MKDFISNLLVRLSSRKLWLAVAGLITALVNGDYNAAAAVVVAYLLAQGYVDAQQSK